MSYCRFSTDDFQCDLYCFEDCGGGFTTMVAGIRYIFCDPLPPPIDMQADMEGWWKRHEKVLEMVQKAKTEPLNLPHDGETFNDPTLSAMLDRIMGLRVLGYRVPEYVIDNIKKEQHPAPGLERR